MPSSSGSSKRYYFEHLQLNSTQLKLSVSSAGRLPEDLQSLKSSLGLILVNLEDATIDLGGCTKPGYWKDFVATLLNQFSVIPHNEMNPKTLETKS